jgi:hypothetical protein
LFTGGIARHSKVSRLFNAGNSAALIRRSVVRGSRLSSSSFRTPDAVLDLIGDQRPCACAKGTVDALLIRWQVQCGADRERDLPHEPQVLHLPDVRAPQIRFDEDLQRVASASTRNDLDKPIGGGRDGFWRRLARDVLGWKYAEVRISIASDLSL